MLTFLIVLAIIWATWIIGIVITNKPHGKGMSTGAFIVIPVLFSIIFSVVYLFSKKVAVYVMLGINGFFCLLFLFFAICLIIDKLKMMFPAVFGTIRKPVNLGSHYTALGDKVMFGNVHIKDAHVLSFKYLFHAFAKDEKFVYYMGHKIIGADPKTFNQVFEQYAKDKNHIYRGSEKIRGAHVSSFKILRDSEFAKDSDYGFYEGKRLPGIDVKTFNILQDGYSKDKDKIYYHANKVNCKSPSAFKVTRNGYAVCKGKKKIFYFKGKKCSIPKSNYKIIKLYENLTGGISLSLRLNESNQIIFSSCNWGEDIEKRYGDDDIETYWEIKPKHKSKLIRALMNDKKIPREKRKNTKAVYLMDQKEKNKLLIKLCKLRFKTDDNVEEWLKQKHIPFNLKTF